MKKHESPSQRFRFTTRGLLLLTLLSAGVTASGVFVYNATRHRAGFGPYPTVDEWPMSLLKLIGDDETLRQNVEPYGLGQFIDHRSIWRIRTGSPLGDALLKNGNLVAANINHPKSSELIDSLPSRWGKYKWDRCTWYSTPGYGTNHIEGVDLYLIADDPATGDLIVLHEWIF